MRGCVIATVQSFVLLVFTSACLDVLLYGCMPTRDHKRQVAVQKHLQAGKQEQSKILDEYMEAMSEW
jgi:hypothetical protein